MSSKLIDPDAAIELAPWLGFTVDEPSVAPAFEERPPPPPPAPVQEDAAPLRLRIRELEEEIALIRSHVIPDEKRAAFQEGFAKGSSQESAKWSAALENAAKAAAALAGEKPRLRREVEADAVKLSLAIARKILRRELAVDPTAVLGLVRVALEKIGARDVLAIRVAPSDAGPLAVKIRGLNLPERVQLIPDSSLAPGSAVLDSTQGQIVASVDSQLEEIERGLADALDRQIA